MQQQTKLLQDPELFSHTWNLINSYPDYDQNSFDYLDKAIERLPDETASILVTIFWVFGYLQDEIDISIWMDDLEYVPTVHAQHSLCAKAEVIWPLALFD